VQCGYQVQGLWSTTTRVTFRKLTADKQYMMGAQPQDDRIIVKNDVDNVSGYTVGTLTIIDALTDNDGLYECVAKNIDGVAYKRTAI